MPYYFGFKPSDNLSQMLDDSLDLINEDTDKSKSDEPYYILRNKTAKQISHELIENLMVNIIDIIPDENRKQSMKKVISTVENSTETMLGLFLGKDKNAEVMPNIYYLRDETIFYDNEGDRRVGCELEDGFAESIINAFDLSSTDEIDRELINKSLITLNNIVLEHFITRFASTLPLGMIKRKSVPMAYAGISKGIEVAINKLFPQLDDAALRRLVGFYSPFIVKKSQ